jgi:uncharacterized protein (TIGR03435 family)
MKTAIVTLLLSILSCTIFGQGKLLSVGDPAPDIDIKHIINAPVTSFSLNEPKDKKIYIINFWGTWCSPCIPEMDTLAKLQRANKGKIQIIGMSDDSPERLKTYLKKKPSEIWLATDTTWLLYEMMALKSVGHSAILDEKRKIVALVTTHSINQHMINQLIAGQKIESNAALKEKKITNSDDPFRVDSTLKENFTVRTYMQGQQSQTRNFSKGIYKNRRINYQNSTMGRMFTDAYQIMSPKQVIYEFDEKKWCDYSNKDHLFCLDLLVSPEQTDSFYLIFQKRLAQVFPIKAKTEYRNMPVYALTLAANKTFNSPLSKEKVLSYSFSGKGFDGTGVTVTQFAELYLDNELGLPVVDETGITGNYDISTSMDMRGLEGIKKTIASLGLQITKTERKIKVLVLSE